MNNKCCAILRIVAMIGLSMCALAAAAARVDYAKTLADFVQQSWKVPSFQLGRDAVMSTVSLRVLTYL